ncbi:cupredoxin domain-containing protein [Pseudomonas sp. sp1636]|uniref:cupredoxin domain-containing protein n=1 Tax=Pseudomonas sp. sp1636 TaxID=3036707 RepID=UPI0025A58CDD|nr:cupredoxin domain-containing protein [Pseudomonas sp. sp1636]MDM8349678.1 cupredoxin domain-containing protein [Pseudomonas sp. sp1636]
MWLINIAGLALIALIIWWFWLYKPKEVALGEQGLLVVVENGGYTPTNIQLPAHTPTILTFLRKDATPCAEVVLWPDLDISETLPLNKPTQVALPALDAGDYAFHCQMQMYRGALHVK